MRALALIPIALLMSACWTPGPGQVDPTRYPWDQRKPEPQAKPQQEFYCIRPVPPTRASGITASGKPFHFGCVAPTVPSEQPRGSPPVPPLPYCKTSNQVWATDSNPPPRRFPSDCVIPGPGVDSPLGPAWVYREVAEGITVRIKLRDITDDELAAYYPKKPPLPTFPPPTVPPRSEAEQFAADCTVHEARLKGPVEEYGITVADNGTGIVENYLKFYAISQDRRYALLWDLAFHASCKDGKRGMHAVQLATPKGKVIHQYRISTELICHGFKHVPPWDQPWYLC